ncbi:MAG: hypothetical protein H0W02_03125 [Ktedonobacteraceae bacterium]|nr:hypothetical protein [Ktedonobacteraceae bacterium]
MCKVKSVKPEEEEMIEIRAENQVLREQLAQRDEQIMHLQQRLPAWEERVSKDSHNGYLPMASRQ